MTIIAAINDPAKNITWIGSDTMGVYGDVGIDVGSKWARHGKWACGVCGHGRTINLIQHFTEELLSDLEGPMDFSIRLREMLKEDGYQGDDSTGAGYNFRQGAILASPTEIWCIDHVFGHHERTGDGFWADGSGDHFALGAAYAASQRNTPAKKILKFALEAAMKFDVGCGGNLWMARLG